MRKWLGMLLLAALGSGVLAQTPEPSSNASVVEPQAAPVAASTPVQPRKYAVLSLIGDKLRIVNWGDEYSVVPLPSPELDRIALLAANDVLQKSQPQTPIVLLAPTQSLYAAQSTLLTDGKFWAPPELEVTLKAQEVSHLVLISKHRAPAAVQFEDQTVGRGKLAGLGYYLNTHSAVWRTDTKESSWGFLAPYVYISIALIDLNQSRVVEAKAITATQTITSIGVKGVINPWKVMTSEQKMELLKAMVKEQVTATVAKLL